MPITFSAQEEHLRRLLFSPCKTREECHQWVEFFLDLDLPGCIVDEASNCTPLDMVWECYSHQVHGPENEDVSRILYYSCREGGKSLDESVIEVMLLFHARNNIFHLAAIREQSATVQGYIKKFLSRPLLRPFVGGDSRAITGLFFYVPVDGVGFYLSDAEWRTLPPEEQEKYLAVNNNVEVLVATIQSCNSKHGMLVLDEIDVMLGDESRAAYRQSKFIPSESYAANGERRLPLTVLTSTRKTAFGLVQDEINESARTGLVIRHWNILDVTQACPTTRHQPEKEKVTIYSSDELLATKTTEEYLKLPAIEQSKYEKHENCHNGCLNRCKLFFACKGRLATKQTCTSPFLKSITHVQNQFRNSTIEMAQAELQCLHPSTTGLVYPRFAPEKHVIKPAEAYKKIMGEYPPNLNMTKAELVSFVKTRDVPWYGGMDFGYSHNFAYVQGFKDVSKLFVTHALAMPELETDQKLEAMAPYKGDFPAIYPDPEDPGTIRILKNKGYRMIKWTKGRGSVVGGIATVQMKLTPPLGAEPELYFVHDILDDPGMDILLKHLQEHHWKLDAGHKPTDLISDDNKDLPDALRYMVMGVFPYKGRTTVVQGHDGPQSRPTDADGQVQYSVDNWMSQKIAEITGQEMPPVPQSRQIKIQSLDGKTLSFDYKDTEEPEQDDDLQTSSGIIFELG